jgi:hypothetical protein
MRYYYSKLGPVIENKHVISLAIDGGPFKWYVSGFDDPRIKLGSIYPMGATTGHLDIEAPNEPDLLPGASEETESPPDESQPELFRM